MIERQRLRLDEMNNHPGQQQHARADLDQQITHPRAKRFLATAGPDQKDAGDRGQLPEHEQCHHIARAASANRTTGVHHSRDMLFRVFDVQRVDRSDHRCQMKHQPENETEMIDPNHVQRFAEQHNLAIVTQRRQPEPRQANQRKHQRTPSRFSTQQWQQQRTENHQSSRRDVRQKLRHRSSPPRVE